MLLAHLVILPLAVTTVESAFYYPDLQTSLLEHILVDNSGAYASNFSSAITPCTRYVTQTGDAALKSGRTTAAQWLRVMFHDVITANATASTGGIDASIGFETARGENSGSAFNDSFTFWRPFVNGAVSMADLLALGTVMSTSLCGGVSMPYRAGRVDAIAAGVTTGVPAPETDLDETLAFFERAGFYREDAIAFTACGHTMGSVHHGGFPDVVDASAVTPENTNGGANFDSTRGVFDPMVVQEYVSWTGQKGGPLVTTVNVTTQSDLRLYNSDGNSTMQALLAQGDGFLNICANLFERAINTVPSGVQLGRVVSAMSVKPVNTTFDVRPDGELVLSGKIRILLPADMQVPTSISFTIGHQTTELPRQSDTGSSLLGTTTYFAFAIPPLATSRATSFSVSGAGVAAQSFPIQSRMFIVPSQTSLFGTALSVVVASGVQCGQINVDASVPVKQPGTLAPRIIKVALSPDDADAAILGSRSLRCNFAASLDDIPTGAVIVTATSAEGIVDTLLVNGGAAGW